MNRTLLTFLDYEAPGAGQQPVSTSRRPRANSQPVFRPGGTTGHSHPDTIPAANLTIEADEGQVRQVLLNLLINALEASPQGGTVSVCMDYEPRIAPDAAGIEAAPARLRTHRSCRQRQRPPRGTRRSDLRAVCQHEGHRGPGWGWRSASGSSKSMEVKSWRRTAPQEAPSSQSGCRWAASGDNILRKAGHKLHSRPRERRSCRHC